MTAPEVVNLKTCGDFGKRPGDVYVGRPTKWGNPFSVVKYGRGPCIAKYAQWVSDEIAAGRLDLNELKDAQRLGCWCAPLACHATVLAELILRQEEKL